MVEEVYLGAQGNEDPGGVHPSLKPRFDWSQLACATIRESKIAQPATWDTQDEEVLEYLEADLEALLDRLDALSKSGEFILMWDLENTLDALAEANLDIVLDRLRRWALNVEPNLQPFFGIRCLARLAPNFPKRVADELLSFSRHRAYREDFWLARVWIFAARSLVDHRHHLGRERLRRLREVVLDMASPSCPCPAIRGVALPALPFLFTSNADLKAVDALVEDSVEASPLFWGLWNLAFELRFWPLETRDARWFWQILKRLAEVGDPHLLYAIAGTAMARPEANVQGLERFWWDNPWLPDQHGGGEAPNGQLGIAYSPAFLEPAYDNHVECRERVQAFIHLLQEKGEGYFQWIHPRPVELWEVRKVHNPEVDQHRDRRSWPGYVEDVRQAGRQLKKAQGAFGTETRSGPSELRFESYEIALLSAGGCRSAVDYVLRDTARCAFSLGRPPGHLANNTVCIFNNIAIAARRAQSLGAERLMVIDFDAHHGYHTSRVFWQDADVIYFSMHMDGPSAREMGLPRHVGQGKGKGYTFNINYPPTMPDAGSAYIVDQLLTPLLMEFKPEMLLLSAGFDGHWKDRFSNGQLSERAYLHLAEALLEVAETLEIKIVGCLEGGYALEEVSRSLLHMLNVFGGWGLDPEDIGFAEPPPIPAEEHRKAMQGTRRVVQKRVRLMETSCLEDSTYAFDISKEHWQRILKPEEP